MTATEFGTSFEASARTLWCVAAAALYDRSQAEDVVQEAALLAMQKLDELDEPPRNFTAWMGQFVRNVAANHNRRQRRRRTTASDPGVIDRSTPTRAETERSDVLSGHGQLLDGATVFDDQLLGALDTLEETPRACLLLRVLLDMAYAQIALALDIPEGTAMSHVHRARRALAKQLGGIAAPGAPRVEGSP